MFFFLFFLFRLFCTVASEISEHAFSSAKEDTVLACLDSNWTAIQYMENRKLHEQYNVMFFFYFIQSVQISLVGFNWLEFLPQNAAWI